MTDDAPTLKPMLAQVAQGLTLSRDETIEAFELIMTGQAHPAAVGALLAMMQVRGPSVDEIVGAATVMRAKVRPVAVPAGLTVIDTCGTGGDHAGTFNISTAAALVAAGAGRGRDVAVVKHGNRSVTSRSGSSQVLETLGVKLMVNDQTLVRSLEEAGICFCYAPGHHPAMKHAAPIRAALGMRTIFNVLGPLTNPAGARRQVVGVFDAALTEPLAKVLGELGSERAMVVHGASPAGVLDEFSTMGATQVSELAEDGSVETRAFDPTTLGIVAPEPVTLQVHDAPASAEMIRGILDGGRGPAREIVCLNAAAALCVAGLHDDLAPAFDAASEAIDSGAAAAALAKLIEVTQADPS